jgi:KDO2-lipid IV(A) lauroyltransferase
MSRRNALRNWTEYFAVSALMGTVMVLPTRVVTAGLVGLSRVAFWVLRSRRKAALRNVELTLGHAANGPEARAIIRSSFECMALNFVEPVLADRAMGRGARPEDLISVEGAEHLKAAFATGRPVLVCTGHHGAWEMISVYLARCYSPIWALARELDNPLLQSGLLARRLRFVRGSISKTGGAVKLAGVMRKGDGLGLLLDQNAGRKGVILPFLGVPASHHTTAGTLGRLFGAIPLPVYMLRVPGTLRFRMIVEPPIELDGSLSNDESELDVTRRLSQSLEAQVRAAPGQWLWIHDRWRHALRVIRRDGEDDPGSDHSGVPAAQGTNGA